MSKILFLVGDGMGGWPLESLGGRTTLRAAHTPAMDFLTARSRISPSAATRSRTNARIVLLAQ